MKTSVLYISYTGLMDPLGQSQVLHYVLGLAQEHRMTLLTFEKAQALHETARINELKERCRRAGVDWHYLKYHNRPNLAATFYDMVMGIRKGIQLVNATDTKIVHCRSYLASLMGLLVKRETGVQHIFDIRGFWPDERVDGGIWKRNSLKYRIFKRLERTLFLRTDHVVSLTRSAQREIARFDYLQGHMPPVSVIPTCTNLEMFQPKPQPERGSDPEGFTLGYVGSTGSWYMFDQVAQVVRLLFDALPDARFLVLNKGDHGPIRNQLQQADVDLTRVEIRAVPFEQVAAEIARMDAGIFFYQPDWSRRATCPTRMGEFLAVGKPCLANGKVGDVEEIFTDTGTGIVVNDMQPETLEKALRELVTLSRETGITQRCRAAAVKYFSLEDGIRSYATIYYSLANQVKVSRP